MGYDKVAGWTKLNWEVLGAGNAYEGRQNHENILDGVTDLANDEGGFSLRSLGDNTWGRALDGNTMVEEDV
jgi:hypothetical protein